MRRRFWVVLLACGFALGCGGSAKDTDPKLSPNAKPNPKIKLESTGGTGASAPASKQP